jgi:pimeloyl-ACP methyl ester carboxylesterase
MRSFTPSILLSVVVLLPSAAACGQSDSATAGPIRADFEDVGEFWYLSIGNGVELFVHELGDAEGPPVVVLHGGPGADHSYLHGVASGLGDRFHFIFYDQRGSLRSRALGAEYTIELHVEDLEALRAALGAERIQLLAHSAGTTLAYHYLAAHPDRVANMVLVGAVHPVNGAPGAEIYDDEDRALFAERPELMEAFNERPAVADAIREAGLADPSSPRAKARLAVLRQFAADVYHVERWQAHVPLRVNPEVAQATQQSIDWNYDRTGLLTAHPFPITVVNGEFDFVIGPRGSPIWRKLARERMPNVEVVSVPSAGHSAWIDDPDFFRETLDHALQ